MQLRLRLKHVFFSLLAVAIAAADTTVPVFADEDPPEYVDQWATGSAPWGLAVAANGDTYVAEWTANRVVVYESDGDYVGQLGSGFNHPTHIAFDSDGNIYVADTDNHRIVKYNSSHEYITAWGSEGSADGQFEGPYGIAVDSNDNIYVADGSNHRIQKFTSGGDFILKWGSEGSTHGQFDLPIDLAIDMDSGNVYIVDRNNSRIEKYVYDSENEEYDYVHTWGTAGSDDGEFSMPWSICIDADGFVYIADRLNHRIQKFNASGVFQTKWGSYGSGDSQFDDPFGVAVDTEGTVYVADNGNGRVQVFAFLSAVEVDLSLKAGWNMVSVPVVADNMSAGAVFPGVDAVYRWDPGSKSYTVPATIEPEVGYWVAVSSDRTISVTGEPLTEWTSGISTGWNMIGSVHGGSVSFSTPDDDPDGSVEGFVYWWDPTTKSYVYGTTVETGKGYWAACTAPCDLTVGPPPT